MLGYAGFQWGEENAHNTLDKAYEWGPYGQTANSDSGWIYYGTRGALVVAVVAISIATAVGVTEVVFLGNQPILVEGVLFGGRMGSGGILQFRAAGRPPFVRLDYHRLAPGGSKRVHLDFDAWDIKHVTWGK